ncbi:glycosyltransferase family 4 protein [Candidatus Poribacteria bacterium]
MHILFINQYFYPDTASTGQLLTELCVSLAGEHRVSVLCGTPSYNPVKRLKAKWPFEREDYQNVHVFRAASTGFSRTNMIGRCLNYISYLLNAFLSSLLIEKPDIVVAMTDPPIAGLIGLLVKKRRKVPVVTVVHDLHPDIGVILGKIRNPLVIKTVDTIVRFILTKAEHVITIGRSMQQRIEDKGVDTDKTSVISNWVDVDLISPQPKENPFSLEHGIVDDFTVMYSGNIGLSQNLDSIIDAASILSDVPRIRFLLIGDGATKAGLIGKAERRGLKNILFLPYQPKEMLRYSLSSGDLHLVPLDRRLQGYIVPSKIYGIMAAGRPFLALVNQHSEVAEIARQFNCGVVVEPDNAETLAEAIRGLLNSSQYLEEMGHRGRETAVEYFGRELIRDQYGKLLREVTEKANNGNQH